MDNKIQMKVPRKKVKVEQKGGLVFVNGKKATLMLETYDDMDLSTLGEGGRVCYKMNNIIIKFNDFLFRQSEKEIKRWKKIKPSHRKFFSKILDWEEGKYGWVAVLDEEFEHLSNVPEEWKEVFDYLINHYKIKDVFDDCPNNWGIRAKDGTLIIYDFGL